MGFRSIKLLGEAASADHVKAAEFPEKLKKVIDDGNYLPCQIVNVDESGLIFKMPPSRTYVSNVNAKRSAGTKLLKDRFTLLLGMYHFLR